MAEFKRPGGELSNRPLHFIWMVDCSGSMHGEKIGKVNHAIQSTIPEMADAARNNPYAELLIRTLAFSSGASWVTSKPVNIEEFSWTDLTAEGVTDMGRAFDLVSDQLTIPPMSDRALPPVLVLISDGQPTDDYKTALNRLLGLPWGKKAVRIAVSIGQDADDSVLREFTGNNELVLQANNAVDLVKMIKWASTAAAMVSAPSTPPAIASETSENPQVSEKSQTSETRRADSANGSDGKSVAPLVLDINTIPSVTDDDSADNVW